VTRVLDLAILLLLAAAILLPRPDVTVKAALPEDPAVRQRVAELQSGLLATPGNPAVALELADLFMDLRHPDWALASLEGAIDAHPDDHRLHHLASLALAEHFDAAHAYIAAQRALTLCEVGSSVPCGEAELGRLNLLKSALERVKNMDMRQHPDLAKIQLVQGLRMTFNPKKAAAKPRDPSKPAPRP